MPDDRSIDKTPTWKERVQNMIEYVWARVQSNPLLWIAATLCVVSALTFTLGGVYRSIRDHAVSADYISVREGTIKEASDWMKSDNIKSITKVIVYEKPSFVDMDLITLQVFESKKGEKMRLNANVLPEEFWKKITEAGEKNAFVLSVGEYFPRTSMVKTISGFMFFYSAIIMVILFAQLMVGQVVSGHTFTADARDKNITLKDIIGYDDVKQEVVEILDKLNNASRYQKLGMKPPRGLLLLGDPGVGKTMLAKAIANEMKGQFFYCTGADFAEMYVGVGPRRVRTLFKRARKAGRSVIFVDEIDAIGARNTMGNDSERQGVINQFLAEMDGVNNNAGILVVGATNHAELLDPALRRPGRFDKDIHIPLPDTKTREGILEHYLKNYEKDDTVDLKALAHRTQGYSGAMLAGLAEDAKNLALRDIGGLKLSQDLLETAQEIKLLGIGKTKAHDDDIDRVVVHELGHALAALVHCSKDVHVEKVTVSGRGRALGYCAMRPLRDNFLRTKEAMEGELIVKLAGRAAEEVILGGVSSGAADDLDRASHLARDMVERFGMGTRTGLMVPPRSVDPGRMADSTKEDVQDILKEMYERAKKTVSAQKAWIENNRQALREKETLMHEELVLGMSVMG